MTNSGDTQLASHDLSVGMPVAERFVSINGEGQQAGKLSAFVRFVGCNLCCSYCDTRWATAQTAPRERVSIADLVSFVQEAGVVCVTLTGGEPLLQPELPTLVRALLTMPLDEVAPQGRWIEIETNGSVSLEPLACLRASLCSCAGRGRVVPGKGGATNSPAKPTQGSAVELMGDCIQEDAKMPIQQQHSPAVGACLSFTMDYKTPSSGMEACMNVDNFAYLEPYDTVKFVVGTQEDLEVMARVIRHYDLVSRCAVYVSPVFGQIDPADIVTFMQQRELSQVRLQLQLHKIIWPHCEKGV